MSKIADKLIEIEDLLAQGLDVETIAKMANVPVDWAIQTELELMGTHQYGYEEDGCQN